ncbi:RES family NAD+ phosphorylase [Arthrobacter sulfonylureivorans]|uniref:RES family NAD+ phosphorylase n=1 Tax=Arthrobacter sulfonylureivorans TaxID=2486855 RepID=UPI0039E42176
MVAPPPDPFTPQTEVLEAGTRIYRVHGNRFRTDEFNPGAGDATRFAFFGSPPVPVLYGASREDVAVCESILHEMPQKGGRLIPSRYRNRVMGRLEVTRDLKLASFWGTGLKALQVEAEELTGSKPTTYGQTVLWAEAAHRAGFDGCIWNSRLCNSGPAYVLFGDRAADAVQIDPGFARVFDTEEGLDWLQRFCAPLHVEVIVRSR